jgi:hypothetical protein
MDAMTAMAHHPQHRVSRAVARLHEILDAVADTSLWSMGPAETAETLTALTRLAAREAELTLRVAAHAETVQVADARVRPRPRPGGPTRPTRPG